MKTKFTAFVSSLGITLSPGQRVLTSVAYDGVNPCDLPRSDREIAGTIFGDVDEVPRGARDVVAAVCGRGSGKSYVFGAARLLHLGLTVDISGLARNEDAYGLIVAPDLRLARLGLKFAIGLAESVPSLAKRIVDKSKDHFTIARDGRHVRFECLPATRGGSAVRGRSLVGALLDEVAFFRDENFAVNDVDIFSAVTPRILKGGQLILASTPWAEVGLLYELFRDNFSDPDTALVARAATLTMRDDPQTRAMVAREQRRDPDNAAVEFGAEFMSGGAGLFLDPAAVEACVDENMVLPIPPNRNGAPCATGADFGFVHDSSALAIVQNVGGALYLLSLEERRPQRGKPLSPSAMAADFAGHAKKYGCPTIAADHYYARTIHEELAKHRVLFAPVHGGEHGKVDSYLELRRLINDRLIRLPRHTRLLNQLKSLISKPTSGGGLQISSPRHGNSGHGDLVSALVCAVVHAAHGAPHKYKGAELENLRRGGRYQTPAGSDAFFGDAYPRAGSCREDGPPGYHGMAGRDLVNAIVPHVQFQ